MQIEFTKGVARGPSKLGIKLHRPQSNVREQHSRISTNKRLLYTPPTCPSNVRKIFFKRRKKWKRREIVNFGEREKGRKKEKRIFDSVNIDTGHDVYTVGLFIPTVPSWFSKGAPHTHTHIGKPSRKIKKIKLYNDSCLFFFCATTTVTSEYKITTQSAKRHNGAPNSI